MLKITAPNCALSLPLVLLLRFILKRSRNKIHKLSAPLYKPQGSKVAAYSPEFTVKWIQRAVENPLPIHKCRIDPDLLLQNRAIPLTSITLGNIWKRTFAITQCTVLFLLMKVLNLNEFKPKLPRAFKFSGSTNDNKKSSIYLQSGTVCSWVIIVYKATGFGNYFVSCLYFWLHIALFNWTLHCCNEYFLWNTVKLYRIFAI